MEIGAELVRSLIDEQFPNWSGLAVRQVDFNGWDNSTFRLGDDMKVRLPTAAGYVFQVEKEYRWLPELQKFLPVEIPAPLALGRPNAHYPYPWSIYRWIDGETAAQALDAGGPELATELAGFLIALHQIPTDGAPVAGAQNFFRGAALSVYNGDTQRCLALLQHEIDTARLGDIWAAALASQWDQPSVWIHGDFASGNLLVRNGHLSAVIDFGTSAVGDPACDLVIAWTFLDEEGRRKFRAALPMDAKTWARGRGWALWKALLILTDDSKTSAERAAAGRVIAIVQREHEDQSL